MSEVEIDETGTGKYLSHWVSYETITKNVGESDRSRVLGRLEGFMGSGEVIGNEILKQLLMEQGFLAEEATDLASAQHQGIRKGLDLGYNDKGEFWEAHAERLGNIPIIMGYRSGRLQDE